MKYVHRTKLSQSRLINGAVDLMPNGSWRIWLHTVDWVHGTTLNLCPDGSIVRVTNYKGDTPDDIVEIAPPANRS